MENKPQTTQSEGLRHSEALPYSLESNARKQNLLQKGQKLTGETKLQRIEDPGALIESYNCIVQAKLKTGFIDENLLKDVKDNGIFVSTQGVQNDLRKAQIRQKNKTNKQEKIDETIEQCILELQRGMQQKQDIHQQKQIPQQDVKNLLKMNAIQLKELYKKLDKIIDNKSNLSNLCTALTCIIPSVITFGLLYYAINSKNTESSQDKYYTGAGITGTIALFALGAIIYNACRTPDPITVDMKSISNIICEEFLNIIKSSEYLTNCTNSLTSVITNLELAKENIVNNEAFKNIQQSNNEYATQIITAMDNIITNVDKVNQEIYNPKTKYLMDQSALSVKDTQNKTQDILINNNQHNTIVPINNKQQQGLQQ